MPNEQGKETGKERGLGWIPEDPDLCDGAEGDGGEDGAGAGDGAGGEDRAEGARGEGDGGNN